MIIIDLMM